MWFSANNRIRCLICDLSVSAPPDLRTFSTMQACQTRILRHIPAASRPFWSWTLSSALAIAAQTNSAGSWQELLMLPQAVLDAARRAGHKYAKEAYRVEPLQWWEAGERMTLSDSPHKVTVRHGGLRSAAGRRDFALG